jgi:hypothetical protein
VLMKCKFLVEMTFSCEKYIFMIIVGCKMGHSDLNSYCFVSVRNRDFST